MQVVIAFNLARSFHHRNRAEFWRAFWGDGDSIDADYRAQESEERIRYQFGKQLAFLIGKNFDGKISPLEIRVQAIRYGSIELLLNVLGPEEMMREMFWTALEFYAPQAFNETLGASVELHAQVIMRDGFPYKKETKMVAEERSMVVARAAPLFVGLIIWAVTFYAMIEEKKLAAEERKWMNEEHTKILTTLMTQNATLSTALTQRVSTTNALEQATTRQLLSNMGAPPLPPAPVKPEPPQEPK